MDPIVEQALALASSNANMFQVGMEIANDKFYQRIRHLEAAYHRASADPETKIPSYLMAMIVSLINTLPEHYADAAIKRDKFTRHEGRQDQDLSVQGAPLKVGT